MNANELADELDNMLKAIGLTDNRVPTMLRQQQAEIEALEKQNHDIYENGAKVIDGCDKKIEEVIGELHDLQVRYDKLWDEASQQQAEIEALRKFKAEIDAENKKLFESVQKANAMWDRATGVKNEQ